MDIPKKTLDKPTKGWRHDLPSPAVSPDEKLLPLGLPPNQADEVYLEIHTPRLLNRGFIIWLALPMFAFSAFLFKLIIVEAGIKGFIADPSGVLMLAAGVLMCLVVGIAGIRMDAGPPRDEPIRFNRKRRKVYVYRFHEGWVLGRKGWGVHPVVFNWDDLRAEAWSRMGPTTTAVPIFAWGVDIAVVEPGTNHVIDRFQLAGSNANGEHMWAMARAFMNHGPDALPTYPQLPRDWNNDVPWYNLALRLAPKVQWPADMDRESRTAP